MTNTDMILMWVSDIITLAATLFSFIYGIRHFFKKGKPLFLQSITMAMGCHSLASVYHLCMTYTTGGMLEGFTPAYLGKIGFFLFFIAASYGQMDKIVDDGTPDMRPSRLIALLAPLVAILIYIPNYRMYDLPNITKVTYFIVWIPAVISVYFHLKHAIIPDKDFGFIKAIRRYNVMALCLGLSELLTLTAWAFWYYLQIAISTVIFAILCIMTMISAKKGVEKWTI